MSTSHELRKGLMKGETVLGRRLRKVIDHVTQSRKGKYWSQSV